MIKRVKIRHCLTLDIDNSLHQKLIHFNNIYNRLQESTNKVKYV